MFLHNVGNHIHSDAALHHRRLDSTELYQLVSLSTLTQTKPATCFTHKVQTKDKCSAPSTTVNLSYCEAKTQVQSLNGSNFNSNSTVQPAAKTLYTSENYKTKYNCCVMKQLKSQVPTQLFITVTLTQELTTCFT